MRFLYKHLGNTASIFEEITKQLKNFNVMLQLVFCGSMNLSRQSSKLTKLSIRRLPWMLKQ